MIAHEQTVHTIEGEAIKVGETILVFKGLRSAKQSFVGLYRLAKRTCGATTLNVAFMRTLGMEWQASATNARSS